ncbi:pyridoxal phosphate-dependent decarboxylase family protein [Pseudonocardia endophytica]|uniref:Glutamate/tyrosine decarboxylase-like PLP-dependent enzyme n=1 Tax=Pseudonocardia endophytica TaxID=401976 RepID=A0A4R1HYP1_PSEEN|nr:aminotransferase class V-fold PLP-dependent enzyme [Pseudonocardia endophytica]TCK25209.1 glutamate/tyrosine decarboxylase-like PLP-dependent enzyme [Pseudonocardia endophytica]
MPEPGDTVLARLEALRGGDLPTHGGRTLAYVYDSGLAEADRVGREALASFGSTNGLDPTAFPSLAAMERDLVAFARPLFHAPEGAVGTVTSGGTESILLAVQTARDARSDVESPVMVAPSTVHGAFHKAAHYFGVELVTVDVDPDTMRADPGAMADAMDAAGERLVLVAVSAPSYAHGVVDPVAVVAADAAGRGVRCHVDACIGGWVLPWMAHPDPWDFVVPGVTSLSADLHKYAYTPKGVSLLLYRDPALRRPQFFASADWPGYTMLNATMQSTRSGGPLAAAWAVVAHIGADGYRALVATTVDATRVLADAVRGTEHLRLAAEPDASLLAVACDDALDVFTLSDEMGERGWFVQPQMAFRGLPATLHLTVCAATAGGVDDFVVALRESVDAAVAAGPVTVDPDLRAAAAALDPSTLDDAAFDGLLALAGLGGSVDPASAGGSTSAGGTVSVPKRMAPVNALLDVAPPRLREALLIAFLDRLTR